MTSSKELTPTFRNTHETCITKHAKLDFTVTVQNEDVLDKSIPHLTACKAYFSVENDGKQIKTQCLYSIPELGGDVESNMEQPQSKSPATEKRAMIESNVKLMDPESLPSGLRTCAAVESHVQTQLQGPSPVATQSNVLQFRRLSLVPSTSFAIESDVVQVSSSSYSLIPGISTATNGVVQMQFIPDNSSTIESNIVPLGSPSLSMFPRTSDSNLVQIQFRSSLPFPETNKIQITEDRGTRRINPKRCKKKLNFDKCYLDCVDDVDTLLLNEAFVSDDSTDWSEEEESSDEMEDGDQHTKTAKRNKNKQGKHKDKNKTKALIKKENEEEKEKAKCN
ncbi:uncharacterized protein LOC123655218 [Melitaea cinxia]|uniref:uncharacterized protein LOC123655218 n=1 Tax=Melitaea cinxia TaxID=113334 RepID=UPI001E273ECF|nr:uncharacterized protein LOC123655218 [Melitaea cinxia]